MRAVLLFIFIISFGTSFAQNERPTKNAEAEEQESRPVMDADKKLELDSISSRKSNADYRKGKKSDKDVQTIELKEEVNSVGNASQSGKVNVAADQQMNAVTTNFKATKLQSSYQRTQRTPSLEQQKDMDDAVDYFESNSPNSFEYHYFRYTAGNYNVDRVNNLKEAEKLRPDNADVHVQLAAFNIIKGNNSEAIRYLEKLIASKRLSKSVLAYAEDLLISTPASGTLITHGFDDSYSVVYVQQKMGIRKDVTLVSLDFLQSDYYRQKLKNKGYKFPSSTSIDVAYYTEFCRMNQTKKISTSLTTPKEYFKPLVNNVYVVGLVFEYSTVPTDNFKKNELLWNSSLKKHLINEAKDDKAKQLSSNYLPMLMQMRKVYNQLGNTSKVNEIDKSIDLIGAQCDKYNQVQKLKKAY